MPDQSNFFDTFTQREATRMESVIADLDGVPWAQGILHSVQQNGGLVGKNMANFFELRLGHAVHKAGLAVEHEVPGEGESTLDFGFTSKGRSWKVEMTRLQETQGRKLQRRWKLTSKVLDGQSKSCPATTGINDSRLKVKR